MAFWIYVVIAAINIAMIYSNGKMFDNETSKVRDATMAEKNQLAGRSLVVSLIVGAIVFLLCRSCHPNWAWFVVLFPFIVAFLILLTLFVGAMGFVLGAMTKAAKENVPDQYNVNWS